MPTCFNFMNNIKKAELENLFRTSNSSNDLFDGFRIAIENKIADIDLYKTLLWNKALSPDEISMFAEKICHDFPDYSYSIYLWVGKIFGTSALIGEHYEKAMSFFMKASSANELPADPLLSIAGIYNKELNIPPFEDVVKVIESRLSKVEHKSGVCFALSDLYKSAGNVREARKYRSLGEKYQKMNS